MYARIKLSLQPSLNLSFVKVRVNVEHLHQILVCVGPCIVVITEE